MPASTTTMSPVRTMPQSRAVVTASWTMSSFSANAVSGSGVAPQLIDNCWRTRWSGVNPRIGTWGRYRRITDAMTDAARRVAHEVEATAILCLTRSGFTVRAIARYRPQVPILGFTPDPRVRRQLSISWGATPLPLTAFAENEDMVREAVTTARDRGVVRTGDIVVVLAGIDGRSRTTDVLRVMQVT